MKLEDILGAAPKPSPAQDHLLFHLTGTIENDHDPAYFRLYWNPRNRRSWLLIKKTDAVGDLYEWTAEETIQKGFTEVKIHRVSVKVGSEVQEVSVAIRKIGEVIAPKSLAVGQVASGCPGGAICCCPEGVLGAGCSCYYDSCPAGQLSSPASSCG